MISATSTAHESTAVALSGTYHNQRSEAVPSHCGYEDWREDLFDDILAFRDVHSAGTEARAPFKLLPTCIGCSKRWACAAQAEPAHKVEKP